jgi:hypothetical protein
MVEQDYNRRGPHIFQEIANSDDYELISEHRNARNEFTLVFEDKSTHVKYTFANVNPSNVPQNLLPEEERTHPQPVIHVHFQDVLNNLNNYQLVTHHKNVRGDLTLVFEDRHTKNRYTFSNVRPDHIPLSVLPENQRENAQPIHVHFSDVANNNRYKLINHHRNFRGDYTLVFEDGTTHQKHSFSNVNPEHIPDHIKKEYDIIDQVQHIHLSDINNNPDQFELVSYHPNVTYSVVFRDKNNGHKLTYSNVRIDTIPAQFRQTVIQNQFSQSLFVPPQNVIQQSAFPPSIFQQQPQMQQQQPVQFQQPPPLPQQQHQQQPLFQQGGPPSYEELAKQLAPPSSNNQMEM